MPRTDETGFGLLPTPDTQFRDNTQTDYDPAAKSMSGRSLPVFVRSNPQIGMWTTPCADDTGARTEKYAQGGTALSTQAGGSLNPEWVEWLMGYPVGWTDLKD
jgi:hypothetical protein